MQRSDSSDDGPVIANGSNLPLPESHTQRQPSSLSPPTHPQSTCGPTEQSDKLLFAAFKNFQIAAEISARETSKYEDRQKCITKAWTNSDDPADAQWNRVRDAVESACHKEQCSNIVGSPAQSLMDDITKLEEDMSYKEGAITHLEDTADYLMDMAGYKFPYHKATLNAGLAKLTKLAQSNPSADFLSRLRSTVNASARPGKESTQRHDKFITQANFVRLQEASNLTFQQEMTKVETEYRQKGDAKAMRKKLRELLTDPNLLTAELYHPPESVTDCTDIAEIARILEQARKPIQGSLDLSMFSANKVTHGSKKKGHPRSTQHQHPSTVDGTKYGQSSGVGPRGGGMYGPGNGSWQGSGGSTDYSGAYQPGGWGGPMTGYGPAAGAPGPSGDGSGSEPYGRPYSGPLPPRNRLDRWGGQT